MAPAPGDPPQPRIRIVRIIARLNIGGPARHVTTLMAGLDPARYDATLIAGSVGSGEGDMSDLVEATGGRVVWIPELGRRIRPWSDLASLWQIMRTIRAVRPDIVETHTAKAGTLGRVAAWLLRVPHIIHVFHGHVFHGYFSPPVTRVFLAIERVLARTCDLLLTVGEGVRRDLIDLRIAPAGKIRVVYLGLDLDGFARDNRAAGQALRWQWGAADDEPVIVNLGRLVPIKHQALFIDLAARWQATGRPGRFVLVGDGSERAALEARVAALGLGDRVVFANWQRDVEAVMAAADLLVNTSRNEGTPMAVIEAMAAGLPVIATAVGGVPDMISDGETGWLVPDNDLDALEAALRDALAAPASIGQPARAFALATYNRSRLLADMDALYRELVSSDNVAAPRQVTT